MKITFVGFLLAISGLSFTPVLAAEPLNFPQGTATPSEVCGKCHKAIYNEFAHAFGAVDPFPAHARDVEEEGRSCNVCHYPEAFAIPDLNVPEMTKPKPR